jgi:putative ABC transport system permease protein
MAAISSRNFNLTGDGEPLRIQGAAVSASFFSVLRIDPVLGRLFTAEEDRPGATRVVALSYRLWTSRFGEDPQILGKTIRLDGESYTVLGVMPPTFHFPDPDDDVWIPLALGPAELANHGSHNLLVIARLKDGVSLTQAQTELTGIAEALTAQYPSTNTGVGVNLVPLHEQVVGDVKPALLILLAATGFILLIVCANVANMLLARAAGRRRELAIRLALGAGRSRVVRQLLTESVLLALVGGVLALALAYAGVEALRTISPPGLPRVTEIGVKGSALAFSIVISALTGLVFGIAPALQVSRQDLHGSLKEGGRDSAPGSRAGMRELLVAVEIALGVVVLVGAGLLLRSFVRLGEVRLGFQPQNVLTQSVLLRGANYATVSQRAAFYQRAIQRIESLPGVKSVAAVSSIPLINARNRAGFTIEGRAPLAPGQLPFAVYRIVTPGYFHTMQIGLLSGRDFSWTDIPETQQVIIINQAMASAYWPNEDALGKRIKLGSLDSHVPWLTVAGIAEDVREFDPITRPLPTLYLPAPQSQRSLEYLVVRASQDPLSLAPAVRNSIWEIDKYLPVSLVRSMESVQGASTATHQFNAILMSLFACLGLVLATTGVYGVTAYSVSQRTHEIGVRMALGARGRDILMLVIRQGLAPLLIGIATGLAGAGVATRLLKTLLFEISATDPVTFASTPLLLAAVALLACWIPARRATKVDPLTALRHD